MGIKTENIQVGQTVKNYKKMCELLGEKTKSGKSKQLQLNDWLRFFKYRIDGHKFIIEEIYSEPVQKIDNRKKGNNNNNKYGEIIQKLILHILNKNGGKLFYPLSYFLKEFKMVHENYKFCEDKVPKLATILESDDYNVYDFYTIVRRNLRDIFETALNKLTKDEYISWEKIPMVSITIAQIERNELNTVKLQGKNNTFVRCDANTIHRMASEEEIALVKETEEKLLEDMGYKNKQQILFAGKYNDFKDSLQKILFEKGNIDYMYFNYEIHMEEKGFEYESEDDCSESLKDILNRFICINTMKNAENRHAKVCEKYSKYWGQIRFESKKDKYRHDEKYVEINNELVSVLLYKDADEIKDEMKKVKNESNEKK